MGRASINSTALNARLQYLSELATERAAKAYREKLREEIIASGRIDTGEMLDRIRVEPGESNAQKVTWRVVPEAEHFRYQDEGTRGTPYKKGRVLRFKPKGSGVFVFAMSTGPITAARYLEKVKERMRPSDWSR